MQNMLAKKETIIQAGSPLRISMILDDWEPSQISPQTTSDFQVLRYVGISLLETSDGISGKVLGQSFAHKTYVQTSRPQRFHTFYFGKKTGSA